MCVHTFSYLIFYLMSQYFLKTQRCKFGLRCKFNHPKDKLVPLVCFTGMAVCCSIICFLCVSRFNILLYSHLGCSRKCGCFHLTWEAIWAPVYGMYIHYVHGSISWKYAIDIFLSWLLINMTTHALYSSSSIRRLENVNLVQHANLIIQRILWYH